MVIIDDNSEPGWFSNLVLPHHPANALQLQWLVRNFRWEIDGELNGRVVPKPNRSQDKQAVSAHAFRFPLGEPFRSCLCFPLNLDRKLHWDSRSTANSFPPNNHFSCLQFRYRNFQSAPLCLGPLPGVPVSQGRRFNNPHTFHPL
jgi:hypothetical protein